MLVIMMTTMMTRTMVRMVLVRRVLGERTDDEYCDRDGVGDRLLMNITLWSYAIMLFLRINVRVQALRRTFASETLGLAWPYR